MKKKINIAEILKDKPEGTKLWTDMFGSVMLYVVTEELWLLHQLVYIGLSCTYTGRGYIIEKLKD